MSRQNDVLKEKIRSFIVKNFMFGQGNLKDDVHLFDSGIVDSLGFIKLLAFIEKTFKVYLDMSEISMGNFNTINDIAETVSAKILK